MQFAHARHVKTTGVTRPAGDGQDGALERRHAGGSPAQFGQPSHQPKHSLRSRPRLARSSRPNWADTALKRAQKGLMFCEHIADDHGMLFIFGDAQPWTFWMKNTKIPLDIIWMDAKNHHPH